jgi:hypothetical protein
MLRFSGPGLAPFILSQGFDRCRLRAAETFRTNRHAGISSRRTWDALYFDVAFCKKHALDRVIKLLSFHAQDDGLALIFIADIVQRSATPTNGLLAFPLKLKLRLNLDKSPARSGVPFDWISQASAPAAGAGMIGAHRARHQPDKVNFVAPTRRR